MGQGGWREQPGLMLSSLPEPIFAVYNSEKNLIVFDAKKLYDFVAEKFHEAREILIDLGDFDTVWIAKFTSVISHETIHSVLHKLEGKEKSCGFDNLYLAEFMEKIPKNSIDTILWSDALETCPIGDTWF